MVVIVCVAGAAAFAQTTQPAATQAESEPTTITSAQQGAHGTAAEALRAELDGLLGADGLPRDTTSAAALERRLEALAARARRLGRSATDVPARLRAGRTELRAIHAMAQQALRTQRPGAAAFRLSRLRHTAARVRALEPPAADAVADYWVLMAEVIDARRNASSPGQAPTRVVAALESFLQAHAGDADAPTGAAVRHARLALLRLFDQAGRTEDAKALLAKLDAPLPDSVPWQQITAACQRVGEQVDFTASTVAGDWPLRARRGSVVIVHFHRGLPKERLHRAVSEAATTYRNLVHLDVNVAPAGAPMEATGPVVTNPDESRRLAERLGVLTLPRLVVIDAQGRIAAAGATPAVVQRAVALAQPATTEPASTQPETDPPPRR